jgi:hypothetical protein
MTGCLTSRHRCVHCAAGRGFIGGQLDAQAAVSMDVASIHSAGTLRKLLLRQTSTLSLHVVHPGLLLGPLFEAGKEACAWVVAPWDQLSCWVCLCFALHSLCMPHWLGTAYCSAIVTTTATVTAALHSTRCSAAYAGNAVQPGLCIVNLQQAVQCSSSQGHI